MHSPVFLLLLVILWGDWGGPGNPNTQGGPDGGGQAVAAFASSQNGSH
jgi:hypothetical protein